MSLEVDGRCINRLFKKKASRKESIPQSLPGIVVYNSSRHDHNHYIFFRHFVERSVFCVHKVSIWHPDAVQHKITKKHGFVEAMIETLISPGLTKKDVQ